MHFLFLHWTGLRDIYVWRGERVGRMYVVLALCQWCICCVYCVSSCKWHIRVLESRQEEFSFWSPGCTWAGWSCQPPHACREHLSRHRLVPAVSSAGPPILLTMSINHPPVRSSRCPDYAMCLPAFGDSVSGRLLQMGCIHFHAIPAFSVALMRGLGWWQGLSETMKVFKILKFALYIEESFLCLLSHVLSLSFSCFLPLILK